jgi:hypothetical protein
MSPNVGEENGAAKASTHEDGSGSGSEFTMVEAPSSESDGIPDTEVEIRDGMSDIHVSERAGPRRKDEYDVDFE